MPKGHAEIFAGNCGFSTQVEAEMQGKVCQLSITSECKAITRLAENLPEVNPYQEISFRRALPQTYEKSIEYCSHAACPVPSGIIKAVEIAAGLALPTNVTIKLSKGD
ncbi:MAG TPA: hypothetical protein DEH25_11185 [Chloroflexi bacterium]|nr:hypothetical protein [Chloroflexota bacterium]HBY08700.1 hypothetical protein [Chloroflexota bacterium]